MSIIDTHAHIFDEQFESDIESVINRARANNIEYILLPNIDSSTIDSLHDVCDKYANYALPMMGLHPSSVDANWKEELGAIEREFGKRKYIAVGEIGIDLYWDKTFEKEQKEVFEEQLRWSIKYDLPVSIHSRNATVEAVECIKRVGAENLKGVFHSFSGTNDELDKILSLKNFYIGINGTVTYKKSTLPEVLSKTDLSHIIIETDSPYLPPVPYRGKRNEPSYTTIITNKLAEIFQLPKEEVENITTKNAKQMFAIN